MGPAGVSWLRLADRRRRAGRFLRAAGTVVCAMVFVAVVTLWVRSRWRIDEYLVYTAEGEVRAVSYDGAFYVNVQVGPTWTYPAPAGLLTVDVSDRFAGVRRWPFRGFDWTDARMGESRFRSVGVPAWLLAVLSGTPMTVGWRRRRRRDGAARRGVCVACGYDLRATPDRCPECGTAAAPVGAA
jgi:hypothetical protein